MALTVYEELVEFIAFDAQEEVPNNDPVILPSTCNDPVNECTSSDVSPNLVEPDWYIIEEEINSVWNSCAVISPVTTNEPVMIYEPDRCLVFLQ